MKPPPFEYHAPRSLDEACGLLARLENVKVLAGGQSLMAMLNLRYIYPDHLIDINKVPGLDGITVEAGQLSIGALVRQRHLEVHAQVRRAAPIFAEALCVVGHRQTRNRGTMGGSLCHLDPAAELPLVALLHDATVRIAAANTVVRTMPMQDFIAGYMSPAIGPEELVIGVAMPLWPPGHGHAFVERSRRHGDFAIASAACLLTADRAGRIRRAALGVGGLGPVPARVPEAEQDLVGSYGEAAVVQRAASRCAGLEALSDFHGQADYRRSIATALVRTAITTAYRRACTLETVQ
jgi:aerobic carbon-monoxide dehydrogenase medium subunit